jgi:hypothetical protein
LQKCREKIGKGKIISELGKKNSQSKAWQKKFKKKAQKKWVDPLDLFFFMLILSFETGD